jgi:hypothetical protein
MALVVFLRGVNVGGHRTFRPSILAQQLKRYDVVNVGAAGTFVIRKPVHQQTTRGHSCGSNDDGCALVSKCILSNDNVAVRCDAARPRVN